MGGLFIKEQWIGHSKVDDYIINITIRRLTIDGNNE